MPKKSLSDFTAICRSHTKPTEPIGRSNARRACELERSGNHRTTPIAMAMGGDDEAVRVQAVIERESDRRLEQRAARVSALPPMTSECVGERKPGRWQTPPTVERGCRHKQEG